ncbi:Probable receptor-like serine/threonine-protein kinase [Striga hermonthica]|uniref:Probable receptor-like serine/threonine-protein kinase n=1 Tax=Striga hermonthica TaxID=68872 RepID=A0A9N7MUF9_STRHE|nr:Probable receptor-like serine/threonine-protein kinase [Striga hermonthica]
MIPSLPAKILIGISLDADESKELLGRAIQVLAQPGDTIVALHVIDKTGGMPNKKTRREEKYVKKRKHQKQFRQAKSFVISIVGDLVNTCQANEVYLEARVGLSSSTGKGLIEEAKITRANYLVIGSNGNKSPNRSERNSFITNLWKKISRIALTLLPNRAPTEISSYCCKNVPDGCSFVLVPRNETLAQHLQANSINEFDVEARCRLWSENSISSEENETILEMKSKKPSPRSVYDFQADDDYEKCSNNSDETISSGSNARSMSTASKGKQQESSNKPKSTFKSISSLFRFSHDLRMRKQNRDDASSFGNQKQGPLLRCFTYQEIASATNDFDIDNMVGQGGYSEVYRGEVENACSIAVKRLAKDSNNSSKKEREFLNELGVIGQVNHPNTAKLVGYCIENGLYLIFEFYPNGTLASALHGETSKTLDWAVRYKIIMGIAKGLHYLHKCCKHRIIHRDIKASNVLLGPDYEPQISDFGLAKWLPNKWSHHLGIPIEGTFGYLAPEYFMHGIVDEKIDVFAFGILVLEIVTGRRPVDSARQNLLLWARPLMESGNLRELVDPKLKGKYEMDQLFKVALTASYCVRQSSLYRPSMTEVIELLKYGEDSEVGWRIPKFTSDEMDDYSMIFGYQLPSDLSIEDI